MTSSLNKLSSRGLEAGLRSRQVFDGLPQTFQALGDANRIRIIWALSKKELNVGERVDRTEMTQPNVSHHLRTLRNLQLVRVRKDGKTSFYSLDDEHINRLLHEGIEHVEDLLS